MRCFWAMLAITWVLSICTVILDLRRGRLTVDRPWKTVMFFFAAPILCSGFGLWLIYGDIVDWFDDRKRKVSS